MPALKRLAPLLLLAACEGPTLYVGDYELPVLDAGEDASDEARDARIVMRDAQLSDGRVDVIFVQPCGEDKDCRDQRWPRCNTNFFVCTNCQFDRDCKQDEYCDMSPYVWRCRDKDRKDEPGGPMGGAP